MGKLSTMLALVTVATIATGCASLEPQRPAEPTYYQDGSLQQGAPERCVELPWSFECRKYAMPVRV